MKFKQLIMALRKKKSTEPKPMKPTKVESDGRKIIVIDFDGVIHSYKSGWQGALEISDAPHGILIRKHGKNDIVYTSIDWLTDLCRDKDLHICILSSRSKTPWAIEAMQDWLLSNGLGLEVLSKISFPSEKPAAFLTIDDRAVRFNGEMLNAGQIKAFKTWQGK